jgi:hypothetical protein
MFLVHIMLTHSLSPAVTRSHMWALTMKFAQHQVHDVGVEGRAGLVWEPQQYNPNLALDSYDLHVIGGALHWVKPVVHACRSETALGCTMRLARRESFTSFTCLPPYAF